MTGLPSATAEGPDSRYGGLLPPHSWKHEQPTNKGSGDTAPITASSPWCSQPPAPRHCQLGANRCSHLSWRLRTVKNTSAMQKTWV